MMQHSSQTTKQLPPQKKQFSEMPPRDMADTMEIHPEADIQFSSDPVI